MLRLAADENFNNDIVRGVRRRFEVGRHVPVRVAIDEIVILAECSIEGEWQGQVRYLPLK
jgi:hypothetical protein